MFECCCLSVIDRAAGRVLRFELFVSRRSTMLAILQKPGLGAAADDLRIRRILEQVQAHLRGEPVEADPPELVRADLVAERLARIIDKAGAIAPPPAPVEPPPAPPSPYFTAEESAAYLGIPYSTFRKRAKFIRRVPQTGRYRREDLDEWAEATRPRRKR